jgi:putative phosphoribosyl transferase
VGEGRFMKTQGQKSEIAIPIGKETLKGELVLPDEASPVVLFAHGSGSSRHSPRNQYVARTLQDACLGTLLFDLLTAQEEEEEYFTRHLRFDIELLADRLRTATRWLSTQNLPQTPRIGYFGSSTGAAAALVAAAELPGQIGAVVSRGGRPDLAAERLKDVTAPTLLLVGGADSEVITLNKQAFAQLRSPKELRIVPGASHLFEEPGALETVARFASDWFLTHLGPQFA